ncbi:MAG: hypothetical protein ABIO22_03665 [Candidatus Saccharimonadales bacterium]
MTNVTHFFHKPSAVLKVNSKTPTEGGATVNSQKGEKTSNTSTDTTQPGDTKSNTGSAVTLALIAPTGDFVSNHHPNLSGSPAPNTISSVCTTTPGASCTISFTKDGVTKSLPTQTTDRAGSAYWNWKLQDINLTAGSWNITAAATLSGQTKVASDPMDIVVAQ